MEILDITSIRDTRVGRFAKIPKVSVCFVLPGCRGMEELPAPLTQAEAVQPGFMLQEGEKNLSAHIRAM